MSFTVREFRDALGLFPTGVAIVTTVDAQGQPAGITVNSFTSVSLDPPLILVSVARTSRNFDLFNVVNHFAVNLLREEQRQISTAFASPTADRFGSVRHRPGHGNVPLIEAHLVAFECEAYARHDGGDHVLLLGKVLRLSITPDLPPKPLLYFRGQYRELSELHAELAPFRLEGW
ncbi:MAG TPA: flavin reductase family protein [Stellaceae bacterium]|jgi:flavin reductase (DIM6/NTAB) family NADH-FMN oxidoreductase RutF